MWIMDDITGKTFGHWKVLKQMDWRKGAKNREYLCQCGSCGGLYVVRYDNLIKGKSTQCACCGLHWKKHRRRMVPDE